MSGQEDVRDELKRLRRALEALAAGRDAIERRPHFLLRHATKTSEGKDPGGIESFVDHFAFAVQRGNARLI
jgi:hypothetical protein